MNRRTGIENVEIKIYKFIFAALVIPFVMVVGMGITGGVLDVFLDAPHGFTFKQIFTGIGGIGAIIYYFKIIVQKAIKFAREV